MEGEDRTRSRVDGVEPGGELGQGEVFAGSYRAGSRVEACQDYELVGYPQGAATVAGRLVHGPVEDAVRRGPYDAGAGWGDHPQAVCAEGDGPGHPARAGWRPYPAWHRRAVASGAPVA